MYDNIINYGGKQTPTYNVDPGQTAPDYQPVNQVAINNRTGTPYDPDYWTREAQRRAIQTSNGQRPDPARFSGTGAYANQQAAGNNWIIDPQGNFQYYDPTAKSWNSYKSLDEFYNSKSLTDTDRSTHPEWFYGQQAENEARNAQRLKDFDVTNLQQKGAMQAPMTKYAPSYGV